MTDDRDKKMRALRAIYDGLRMALDGAYQLACLHDSQANDQAGASTRIVTETAPAPSDRRELTVKDLAARWGVSTRSIYQWTLTQGLPYRKMGRLLRFDPIKVDQWANGHRESFNKARLRVVR